MDRSRYPWLIVGTHHPLYCSRLPGSDCRTDADNIRNGVPIEGPALTTSREHDGPARGERESWGEGIRDGTGLERLFYENGVDLFLSGHVHNYERHFDIAPSPEPQHEWTDGVTTRRTIDPPATTYIVTGAAGNVERHAPLCCVAEGHERYCPGCLVGGCARCACAAAPCTPTHADAGWCTGRLRAKRVSARVRNPGARERCALAPTGVGRTPTWAVAHAMGVSGAKRRCNTASLLQWRLKAAPGRQARAETRR